MVVDGYPEKMGGDGFTPGTQRFAWGLFIISLLLLGPHILKAFKDPEPEPPRVPFTGQAITFDVGKSVCGPEFQAKNSDLVAALHQKHWKHPNPTKDLNCARSVKITELESSKEKSVIAKVYTKCIHGCKIPDIALSDAAFKKLSKDGGTSLKVTWDFTD
ncbi:uncharacterized protein LOC110860465 [Folsomia candida]|uniref:Papain inhibitor n=1 Tax=Folsomia candida TaxID=158441 RepID=A0A226D5H3_FOLCA|nr:uncharacterized protein LOC110860465 [Folsomia candida]OXA40812.1 Papain inhibitor [Folsomia candida]